ncbi:MAG: hypothetical protein AAF806_17830 [Bacteroidota bacterium]
MPNYFLENRHKVQEAMLKEGFVLPLVSDEILIAEPANNANLKQVKITNIPYNIDQTVSWVMDAEFKGKRLFSNAQSIRTVEKVLMVMTKKAFLICMIELKSSISDWEKDTRSLDDIVDRKFRDTIDKVCLFLPIEVRDNRYENIKLNFKGITFFNKEKVITEPNNLAHRKIHNIFKSEMQSGRIRLDTSIQGNVPLDLQFMKNPNQNQLFTISFHEIYPSFDTADLFYPN